MTMHIAIYVVFCLCLIKYFLNLHFLLVELMKVKFQITVMIACVAGKNTVYIYIYI
jgi:hypothetical protein